MSRGMSREEVANSLTHGVGVLLSVAGLWVLTSRSLWHASIAETIGVCVYGVTLVGVFAASTLCHATVGRRWNNVFLWLDHCCVYALIAGTYTPFMLSVLRGATGAAMLSTVWSLAALGIVSKTILKLRSDLLSVSSYLLMGWLIVVVIQPFARQIGRAGLVLLLAGGLCYSLGVIFFYSKRAYSHAIWHVCVLVGSTLHYVSVLLYAMPVTKA